MNTSKNIRYYVYASIIILLEIAFYFTILAILCCFFPLIVTIMVIGCFPFEESENKSIQKIVLEYMMLFVLVAIAVMISVVIWFIPLQIANFLSPFIYPENVFVFIVFLLFFIFFYRTVFIKSNFLYKLKVKNLLQTKKMDSFFEQSKPQKNISYLIAKGENYELTVCAFECDKIKKILSIPVLEDQIPTLHKHFSLHSPSVEAISTFCYIYAMIGDQFYIWKNQNLLIKASSKEVMVKGKVIDTRQIIKVLVRISKTSINRKLIVVLNDNKNIILISKNQYSPVLDILYDEFEFISDSSWIYEIARMLAEILVVPFEEQDMGTDNEQATN